MAKDGMMWQLAVPGGRSGRSSVAFCNGCADVSVRKSDDSWRSIVVALGDGCVGVAIVVAGPSICDGGEVVVVV